MTRRAREHGLIEGRGTVARLASAGAAVEHVTVSTGGAELGEVASAFAVAT